MPEGIPLMKNDKNNLGAAFEIKIGPIPTIDDISKLRKTLVGLINRSDPYTVYFIHGLLFQIEKAKKIQGLYRVLLAENEKGAKK